MNDQDKQRFEKTFSRLHLHFPEVGSNGTHLQRLCSSYFSALADIDIENIEAAAVTHINTGAFFPKVSDLRRIIGDQDKGKLSCIMAALAAGHASSLLRAVHSATPEASSNPNDPSTALQPAEQAAAAITAIGGRVISIDVSPLRIADRGEVDVAMHAIPAGDYLAVDVRALVPVATKDQP